MGDFPMHLPLLFGIFHCHVADYRRIIWGSFAKTSLEDLNQEASPSDQTSLVHQRQKLLGPVASHQTWPNKLTSKTTWQFWNFMAFSIAAMVYLMRDPHGVTHGSRIAANRGDISDSPGVRPRGPGYPRVARDIDSD